ncbi:MAG: SpoIIE family protein phosphatase [Clostridia bacterium]|nr:SpoIIE family protein phosphatase [Clostridia bacterium]
MPQTSLTKPGSSKKRRRHLRWPFPVGSSLLTEILLFLLSFFLSRTSIFFGITPLPLSAFLALGGGISPLMGGMLGSYSVGMTQSICSLLAAFLLKKMFREEKWDPLILFVCQTATGGIFLWLAKALPYDVILFCVSLLVGMLGYFVLKKAYRAQFVKPKQLRFTRQETYCSLFLLFALLSGMRTETVVFLADVHTVLKIYCIAIGAYYFGIGGGASCGAVLGMLSGYRVEYSTLLMSVYSLYGFFTGIFCKFSKFTGFLGLLFAYVFSLVYLTGTGNMISFPEVLAGGVLYLVTPNRRIRTYLERYRPSEPIADVTATLNSITANRLDRLAKSFSGLSNQIEHTKKNIRSVTGVNENTLFDFVGERVCRHCSLCHVCWQEKYTDTADAMMKAVSHLSHGGTLEEKHLAPHFTKHCIKLEKVTDSIRNFYELYRLNAVWKHKLSENTGAFQAQFIELSKIICELKQNIEANRYFDARLSSELYSTLGNEGYCVREASVIKTASESYEVRLELKSCRGAQSCVPALRSIIGDVLGVPVTRTDGGCGKGVCHLVFSEGESGKIQQRIQSISKRDFAPTGDSHLISEINRNQYLMALSDGMGSGQEASRVSTSVVTLLDEMMKAGFSPESAYKMLNSFLIAFCSGFSTLDYVLIDLKRMTAKMVKTGACPTFIKRGGEVIVVDNPSLPAGIRPKKPFVKTIHLKEGDMLFMVSDGVMEALPEEDWVYSLIQKNITTDICEAVDLIASVAQQDFEVRADDITVMGIRIVKE